ncbi:hypothetical protein K458DRAFT_362244 [Lentithecium fluviatile CBS 122367]|uniref:Guanine nucleotide-exchange factor SEC12 n=1 Tax=Lentithecium fluviatile CBS 122367 TaxID=1168545 RepID=A0A6G1JB47_9PLEO|nr:hypothetical protein K458DRAFT_362244 [Lentithecium fluviatile CBS 122367]
MSRPTVSKAKTSYPLYAATFASSKPGVLVVGGGGGAGRHGVKNKISVFDFTTRAPTVEPCAEIEASQDDSVTSLAGLGAKDGLIVYAGINSSEEDRLKGNNEHFKSFEVRFPKKTSNAKEEKTPQGSIEFLSKSNLLKTPAADSARREGYQRIVRLSAPPRSISNTPNKRIGVVASGLAGDENEIVVFNATSSRPDNPKDVIERLALHKGQEANDVDIFDAGGGRFSVAYCTDYDVCFGRIQYDFDKRSVRESQRSKKVYSVPFADVSEKKGRPKVRCLRWLSSSHILLLANKPNRTGVELWVLRLYGEGQGTVLLRKKLGRHAKAAVDMDVALLDEDAKGRYQAVIAVAAIDVSLSVLTIDYNGDSMGRFSSFATYYGQVHELQMTKAVFSPFFRPEGTLGKNPAYLRLASISLGNSIDVETFQLQPLAKKPGSRHVLQTASRKALTEGARYLVIAMIVAAIALMLQGFIDPEGHYTKGLIPESLQNAARELTPPPALNHDAREAARFAKPESPMAKTGHRIVELLRLHNSNAEIAASAEQKALVIHHDPEEDGKLSTEIHQGDEDVVKKHTEAKRWEELSNGEQKRWKEKLVHAGMWAVEEGETVLKGIFFSEVGGIIGGVAQGVLG